MGHQFAPITVHPSVYDCLLVMSEGRPLLPRLRELSWSQKATTGREYLALISTTLCRLHLRIEERRGYHPLFSRHDLERGGDLPSAVEAPEVRDTHAEQRRGLLAIDDPIPFEKRRQGDCEARRGASEELQTITERSETLVVRR